MVSSENPFPFCPDQRNPTTSFSGIDLGVGIPVEKINKCMGDPEADTENEVLKIEQELQVNKVLQFNIVITNFRLVIVAEM